MCFEFPFVLSHHFISYAEHSALVVSTEYEDLECIFSCAHIMYIRLPELKIVGYFFTLHVGFEYGLVQCTQGLYCGKTQNCISQGSNAH